jgi:methyl-accepting chemotaxis protein
MFLSFLKGFFTVLLNPFTVIYMLIEFLFFAYYLFKKGSLQNSLNREDNELTEEEIISFTNFWPSFFITLGILGTFIGIIIGIINLDFENENSLKNSINSLLSSMGTAFFSSIIGVIFSIAAQIINKPVVKGLSKITKTNKEKLLDEIIGIRNDIKEFLANPFETISEKANQTVEQYSSSFNQLNETLNNTFEQNINRFSNIVHNISEELNKQFDSIKQQSELIEKREKVIQNEKELLKDFSLIIEKSRETFNEIFEKQKNTVEKLEKVETLIQSIIENKADLNSLNENVLEVINNFKRFTDEFNSNFNEFISSINRVTQQIPNQMSLKYKNAFEEMENFTIEFFSKFKEISVYLYNTIDDFEKSLEYFNYSLNNIRNDIEFAIKDCNAPQKIGQKLRNFCKT